MNDKALHFIAGLVIAIVLGFVFNPLVGFLLAVSAGAAKELWDMMGYGTPELTDFVATAAGGALGAVTIMAPLF